MEQQAQISLSRRKIEERYGAIGTGAKVLFVGGVPMGLRTLSRRLSLLFPDLVPIDAGALGDGTLWIRYYDADQRKVMVIEFSERFDFIAETGADIMDWIGDDYFRVRWRAFCPAGGEEWLGKDMSKGGGG